MPTHLGQIIKERITNNLRNWPTSGSHTNGNCNWAKQVLRSWLLWIVRSLATTSRDDLMFNKSRQQSPRGKARDKPFLQNSALPASGYLDVHHLEFITLEQVLSICINYLLLHNPYSAANTCCQSSAFCTTGTLALVPQTQGEEITQVSEDQETEFTGDQVRSCLPHHSLLSCFNTSALWGERTHEAPCTLA